MINLEWEFYKLPKPNFETELNLKPIKIAILQKTSKITFY